MIFTCHVGHHLLPIVENTLSTALMFEIRQLILHHHVAVNISPILRVEIVCVLLLGNFRWIEHHPMQIEFVFHSEAHCMFYPVSFVDLCIWWISNVSHDDLALPRNNKHRTKVNICCYENEIFNKKSQSVQTNTYRTCSRKQPQFIVDVIVHILACIWWCYWI